MGPELFGNNIRSWAIFGFGIAFAVVGLILVVLAFWGKVEIGKVASSIIACFILAIIVIWASFDITDPNQRVLQGSIGQWVIDLFTVPFGGGS